MILPTKHLRQERALITIGAELLGCLREPMTVSRLWDNLRGPHGAKATRPSINYDWFVLALDLLFMISAIEMERGLVRKTGQ